MATDLIFVKYEIYAIFKLLMKCSLYTCVIVGMDEPHVWFWLHDILHSTHDIMAWLHACMNWMVANVESMDAMAGEGPCVCETSTMAGEGPWVCETSTMAGEGP